MRFRKLRIAFSAVCVIASLLVIALWARSYWWSSIIIPFARSEISIFAHGQLFYGANCSWQWYRDNNREIKLESLNLKIQDIWNPDGRTVHIVRCKLTIPAWATLSAVAVLVTLAAISTCPWRWRFSLRTLLIAMTLISLLLGLVVYASR